MARWQWHSLNALKASSFGLAWSMMKLTAGWQPKSDDVK